MFLSYFPIIVKLPILDLLKGLGGQPNNRICALILMFQLILKLLMKIRHSLPDRSRINPSRMHRNELSMRRILLSKMLHDAQLLSFVSSVLGGAVELLVLHEEVLCEELLG
jgi:hypothetical protein